MNTKQTLAVCLRLSRDRNPARWMASAIPGLPLWIESMGIIRSNPHHFFADNRDQWVLHLCLKGSGSVKTSDTVTEITAPAVLALKPDMYHEHWSNPDDPWDLFHWFIRNDGDISSRLLAELGLDREVNPLNGLDTVTAALAKLADLQPRSQAGIYEGYQAMLAFHTALSRSLVDLPERKDADDLVTRAERAMLHLENTSLNVNELAAQLQVSRATLTRHFKAAAMPSPGDVLTDRRMLRARSILRQEPSIPLKRLAAACGYSDPAYFCRLFRAVHGAPPRQYAAKR